MADTTFEEAKRCPKCDVPGREGLITKPGDGSTLRTMICVTPSCRWYDTGWVVQVMADGSIPVRKPGQKDYPEYSGWVKEKAQRDLDTIVAADAGDEEAIQELHGGEIVDVPKKT